MDRFFCFQIKSFISSTVLIRQSHHSIIQGPGAGRGRGRDRDAQVIQGEVRTIGRRGREQYVCLCLSVHIPLLPAFLPNPLHLNYSFSSFLGHLFARSGPQRGGCSASRTWHRRAARIIVSSVCGGGRCASAAQGK